MISCPSSKKVQVSTQTAVIGEEVMTYCQNRSYIQVSLKKWKQRLGCCYRVILFLRGFCFILSQEGSCGGRGNVISQSSQHTDSWCNICITVVAMVYKCGYSFPCPIPSSERLHLSYRLHSNCVTFLQPVVMQRQDQISQWLPLEPPVQKYSVSGRKIQYVIFFLGRSCW